MALLLPFMILITIGTIELGYYVYTYSELENATRRASEQAAKSPPLDPNNANSATDECVKLAKTAGIEDVFISNLQASNMVISYPETGAKTRTVGTGIIQVQTTYPVRALTPIGDRFFRNLQFNFKSRRTITSTQPPPGRNADCSQ